MSGCLRCGAIPTVQHHPSGRDELGTYFDHHFTVPLCVACHGLEHRTLRALGLAAPLVPSVRVRRLGVFGWSLVEAEEASR